jgi:hypothetical protein
MTEQAPPQPPTPIHRIFTATLILGVSGAGKTSLLATFASYLWETFHKVLVLYSWDGGAIPTEIQKKMHQGLIRFWRCRTRSAPGLELETLYFATKGYLPRRINPQTGETTPAVPLVAPVTTHYALTCPQGHALKSVSVASLITPTYCTECKQMVSRDVMRIAETVERTRGFETIGGVAYDGLTSMANVVMESQDAMRGQGMIGGEKSSFGGVVVSGAVKFGGNNRADVGFAQTRAQQFVNNSLSIPYLLEGPVFTALSTEGSDKGGLAVVGADLPGQAALTQVPQWFGNICGAATVLDSDGQKHFALHVRPFTDKEGRRHLLKTSASPTGPVPDVLLDPAEIEKQPFRQFNLGVLFSLLDEDLRRALLEGVSGAPGTPAEMMEYGDAAAVPSPPELAAGSVAPGHASGIPALTPPTPAQSPGAAPLPAAPPTSAPQAGVPVMAPKPRRGRAAPPTLPAAQPAEHTGIATADPALTQAPLRTAMPIVAQAPTTIPWPLGVSPTGTAPPPPPGAKPPQRAPGEWAIKSIE